MADQPRWPAGAPDDEHGHGQGGRFAPVGTRGRGGWVAQILGRVTRGWTNDEEGRAALLEVAQKQFSIDLGGGPGGYSGETMGGETATVLRVDLPDGRSVVYKTFTEWDEQDWSDYQDDEDYDGDPEDYVDQNPGPSQEDITRANAEWAVAQIAEVIGAPVPPVIRDTGPVSGMASVWMGYIDGGHAGHLMSPEAAEALETDEAWLLGLLDLLVMNEDRHGLNWLIVDGPDGRTPVGIDHGNAQLFDSWTAPALPKSTTDLAVDGAFARMYLDDPRQLNGLQQTPLGNNPLSPDDIDEVARRLRGLLNRVVNQGQLDYMLAVLEMLRPHAKGDLRMVP